MNIEENIYNLLNKRGQASLYGLFIKFMFIAIVMFSIFGLIVSTQNDNDVAIKLTDNTLMNVTIGNLTEDLGALRDKSQEQKTLFEDENPTSGFGTILLFSIVSVGKTFNSMIVGIFNVLITLPVSFLGLDPAIIGIITALLLLTIILGAWRVYKLGG